MRHGPFRGGDLLRRPPRRPGGGQRDEAGRLCQAHPGGAARLRSGEWDGWLWNGGLLGLGLGQLMASCWGWIFGNDTWFYHFWAMFFGDVRR